MKNFLNQKNNLSNNAINTILLFLLIFNYIVYLFDLKIIQGYSLITIALTALFAIISIKKNRNKIKETEKKVISKKKSLLAVILIIIMASFVFSYNLGKQGFKEDEYQVLDAATSYFYAQTYNKWDWRSNQPRNCENTAKTDFCNYTRAWPHTYLISKSYQLFGISEWSSRIVSVFFGLIFVLLMYLTSKHFFKNEGLSILLALVSVFYFEFIHIFRYTRMYALLLPAFLMLTYLIYKFINEESIKNSKNKILSFIQKNANYNYKILILLIILLVLNILIHINSLIILPSVLIFIALLSIHTQKRKYIIMTLSGVIILAIISTLMHFSILPNYIKILSLFEMQNYIYMHQMAKFPIGFNLGVIMLITGIAKMYYYKENRRVLIFLYSILTTSLIFFIWIADRYDCFLYISHISAIAIILITFIYFNLIQVYKSKIIKTSLIVLMLISAIYGFYKHSYQIYIDNQSYGKHKEAYSIIIDQIDIEKDIIMAQYFRTYHIQNTPLTSVQIITIGTKYGYTFNQFIEDINKYESAWLVWDTNKSFHIQPNIIEYADAYFKKMSGTNIDDTRVEIYYFNQEMIK